LREDSKFSKFDVIAIILNIAMIIYTRNPFAFIVLLFCMGAVMLFSGLVALWEQVDYHVNGQTAVMVLAHPERKNFIPTDGFNLHSVDVRYLTNDGELEVPGKLVSSPTVKRLVAGERIPITYLKSNPNHVYLQFEEPKNPWGWLTVSLVMFATFAYALKLRRREIISRKAVSEGT